MGIERLQVQGGFLDGLDINFSSGLNVITGARGMGKTSVIELLRYVLVVGCFFFEIRQLKYNTVASKDMLINSIADAIRA
ncbi:ATP-binding protein [Yersinia enterocolitica]